MRAWFNWRMAEEITERLDRIERLLITMKGQVMTDLTNITQAVNDEVTVEESAITLITNLAAAVTAAGTDPVALQALTDSLNDEKAKLAAAVSANTPAPAPAADPAAQ